MKKRYYNYNLQEWIIAKVEKKYGEKLTTNSKPNFIPVRGKNGFLVVRRISFSSSTEINKFC